MADHQSSSLPSPTIQHPTRPVSSFLGSPRFFNGFLMAKNLSDTESSPTSILDTNKHFSNFGSNPFGFNKNPKKPTKIFEEIKNPSQKFDSEGIALALFEEKPSNNICKPNTISRKVLFGSNLKIQIPSNPSSAPSSNGSPESPGDFGIKTRNLQFSGAPTPTGFGSPRTFTGPLSLSEMELSEDYTRVITHGPNPKTTHIYDDCVIGSPELMEPDPKSESPGFLSFCNTCKKNLDEGSDIFIYRGERAFCSEECRCQEMVMDGLMNS